METYSSTSDLEVHFPPTFRARRADLSSVGSRIVRRRRQSPGAPEPPEYRDVVDAITASDLELVDVVELEPEVEATPPTGRRRSGATPVPPIQDIEVDVYVDAEEKAVLLVEQDGMYAWQYESEASTVTLPGRRRGSGEPARRVKFRVEVHAERDFVPSGPRRGLIKDLLFSRIRVIVLKFVSRVVVREAIDTLEKNVRRGLVIMNEEDPLSWRRVDDASSLERPSGRPARVLLFIHGTFSSTAGSFGALSAYPWGKAFLKDAREQYDHVLGYDHPTLSVDPVENANDLRERLRPLGDVYMDVVTYSRGGLVYRSLVELLPESDWKPLVDRVVFVGVPNKGTLLAEPENWRTLIDLYTNLAVGVFRLIGLVPQVQFASVVLRELVQGLGALVKYLATEALEGGSVPGLAAMQPNGPFINRINEIEAGRPTIETTYYCAITSEFEARVLDGDHEPKELSRRFLLALKDWLADRFMNQENDLVVNCNSMKAIDELGGTYVKDSLDFGRTPHVFHTSYFTRPEVTSALRRWFDLPGPGRMEPVDQPVVRRRSRTTTTPYAWLQWNRSFIPVGVNTNILIADAWTPIARLEQTMRMMRPDYVVVCRDYQGDVLNYAYKSDEVFWYAEQSSPNKSLYNALDLHEYDASPVRELSAPEELTIQSWGTRTAQRTVVLDDGQPIGVVTEREEPASGTELAELAASIDEQGIGGAPNLGGWVREQHLDSLEPTLHAANGGGGPRRSAEPTGGLDEPTPRPGRRRSVRPSLPELSTEAPTSVAHPPETAAVEVPHAAPHLSICHFYAEMDREVTVQVDTTLVVAIASEEIERATEAATSAAQANVALDRKLIVDVRPRRNFIVLDESRVEIDPGTIGERLDLYFTVRPVQTGEGEIWVIFRQGPLPLAQLPIKVQVTDQVPRQHRKVSVKQFASEVPPTVAPFSQLTVFESTAGGSTTYFYDLHIPGVIHRPYTSKPIFGDRQDYVGELYKHIEERWISSRQDVVQFEEELREMGGDLLDELLPPDLQEALWEHRDKIDNIQVLSTEPFIPWELIHLKEPGKPLPAETCFLGQLGLVRWLYSEKPYPYYPDRLVVRPGRARYVIPNYPLDRDKLPEAQAEIDYLVKAFQATPVTPDSQSVRKLLATPGSFDLLHFACHGTSDYGKSSVATLELEGRIENGKYVEDVISEKTVGQQGHFAEDGSRPMVVVNACQSGRLGFKLTGVGGFAEAFLRRGAGAFVGTLWSVSDQPARTFTEMLYTSLLDGSTLAAATVAAREKARTAGEGSWLAYVVYGHPFTRLVKE